MIMCRSFPFYFGRLNPAYPVSFFRYPAFPVSFFRYPASLVWLFPVRLSEPDSPYL